MFSSQLGVMLYVDDVNIEKAFWQSIGFTILNECQVMDYDQFEMKPTPESDVLFTIYDKAFIRQVSPEVVDFMPSILFETDTIYELQEKVASVTSTASAVNKEPFLNFNFRSPSGHYYAVKGNE